MSDLNEHFEPDENDLEEVVIGEEPVESEDEEPVELGPKMTKADYEALVAKAGASQPDLGAQFNKLADTIASRSQPANVASPIQEPELDDTQIETDLFAPGKTRATVEKIAGKMLKDQLAPFQAQMIQQAVAINKRFVASDPQYAEVFKTYEQDIEALVRSVAPAQITPDIYERATKEMISRKLPEIQKKNLDATIADAVNAKLKELGIDPEKLSKTALPEPRQASLGQARVTAQVVQKKQLRITESEKNTMELRGMNPADPIQVKSFLDRKAALGRK